MDISWNEYYLQVTDRIAETLGSNWRISTEELAYIARWYNKDISVDNAVEVFFSVFYSNHG